jgi:hypothetical protein
MRSVKADASTRHRISRCEERSLDPDSRRKMRCWRCRTICQRQGKGTEGRRDTFIRISPNGSQGMPRVRNPIVQSALSRSMTRLGSTPSSGTSARWATPLAKILRCSSSATVPYCLIEASNAAKSTSAVSSIFGCSAGRRSMSRAGILIRHQHSRIAAWGANSVRVKCLPGCRWARSDAKCAVRLMRCE